MRGGPRCTRFALLTLEHAGIFSGTRTPNVSSIPPTNKLVHLRTAARSKRTFRPGLLRHVPELFVSFHAIIIQTECAQQSGVVIFAPDVLKWPKYILSMLRWHPQDLTNLQITSPDHNGSLFSSNADSPVKMAGNGLSFRSVVLASYGLLLPSQAQLYDKVIQTSYGPVQGFNYFDQSTLDTYFNGTSSNVAAFLGVPFAADTGYQNRWKAPQPRERWNGTLIADRFGPACPSAQGQSSYSEVCKKVNQYYNGSLILRTV